MKKIETPFRDLFLIQPDVIRDERGYFLETYHQEKFIELGLTETFVQDNFSYSVQGAIRGLHFQVGKNAQGKLARVITGKVLDVAVDLRVGSPTFGKYYAAELSEENKLMFWVPVGFAHGISVLSDTASFLYKCTRPYSPADERAIRFDDPTLCIDWKVASPLVSEKDRKSFFLKDLEHFFQY